MTRGKFKFLLLNFQNLSSLRLVVLSCLYFEIVLNFSLWRFAFSKIHINSAITLVFAVSLPAFIFFGLFSIFNALIWPYFYKTILILLITVSCVANYVMFQYGVFIDSDMIRNLFQTNRREALDYVNLSGILWYLITGFFPSALIFKSKVVFKPLFKEARDRFIYALICLFALSVLAATLYKEYAVFGRNNREVTRLINPTNYIFSAWRYFRLQALANKEFSPIDPDARLTPFEDDRFTVLVIIVGETARSMSFALNGYNRPTNPRLINQDIISFNDVTASGTSTAVSLPAMFSHLGRDKFILNEAAFSENIIDLISNSGYKVIWLENDNGCKSVCDRVNVRDMVTENNLKYCDGSYCFDEVMIDSLEKLLDQVHEDTVIALHAIGSHGPSYYKRYPFEFKIFQPTCDTSEIQNCSINSIVNTYDNTIIYTDFIINRAIDSLKKYPQFESGLIYISDHGESLGENGIYLHGLPFRLAPDEQIKVPLIVWMSDAMKVYDNIDYNCLINRSAESFSHDNLFHSLVGLLEINTKLYESNLDIFTPCRLKPLPKYLNDN